MLGVDADLLAGATLDHPGELHQRTPRGVEYHPLDFPWASLYAVAIAAAYGYLR